jgi:hypothetical protein
MSQINCQCFCPSAEIPPPLAVVVDTGASQLDVQLFGTAPFSVSLLSNPLLPSGVILVSSVQVYGSTLRVIFSPLSAEDFPGSYSATIRICNACGQYDLTVTVQAQQVAPPPTFDCGTISALFIDAARTPILGDKIFANNAGNCILIDPPAGTTPYVLTCVELVSLFLPPTRPMGVGDAIYAFTSNGCEFVTPVATSFPLLAPDGTCGAPSYSFASNPDAGLLLNPGVPAVILGWDNCDSTVQVGGSVTITGGVNEPGSVIIRTGVVPTSRLAITPVGEWSVGGSGGVAGEVLTSAGPGAPPTWLASGATASPPLNLVQNATGDATRNHAAFNIIWRWTAIGPVESGLTFEETVAGTQNSVSLVRFIVPDNSQTHAMLASHAGLSVFAVGGRNTAALLKGVNGNVTNNAGLGVDLLGGDSHSAGTSSGGFVTIRGGSGRNNLVSGRVFIFGGAGSVINAVAGDVQIGGGNTLAGSVVAGGDVSIAPGSVGGGGVLGGTLRVSTVMGGGVDLLRLPVRADTVAYINTAPGSAAGPIHPNSQPFAIVTNSAPAGGGVVGGIFIGPGVSTGGFGVTTAIVTEAIQLNNGANGATETSDVVAGSQLAGLRATAVRGFFWIPKTIGIPLGVPAKAASFLGASPMCFDSVARTLYIHDGTVWRNMVLL